MDAGLRDIFGREEAAALRKGGAWAGSFLEGVFHLSETEFLRRRASWKYRDFSGKREQRIA